jgi:hypothetical protein
MNLIDFDKASEAAKQAIAELQVAGMAITDEEAKDLHDAIHGALLEASSDVTAVLAPVLTAISELNATAIRILTESGEWRNIIQRFNLSPPGVPK